MRTAIVILALGLLAPMVARPGPAHAQARWLEPPVPGAIRVEYLRPEVDGATFGTAAWYGGFRVPVGPVFALVGELPIAHVDPDADPGLEFTEETTTIGNPWVGAEVGLVESRVVLEAGGRIPVVDGIDAASSLGFLADVVDRPEAFLVDVLPIQGGIRFQTFDRSRFGVVVNGAAAAWFPVDDSERDTEWQAKYGVRAAYFGPRVRALLGVTGRAELSGEGGFAERSVHQGGAALSVRLGPVRPGVQLRVPIDDDLRDLYDFVLGLSLEIEPGR